MNGVDVVELTESIELLKQNTALRSFDIKTKSTWLYGAKSDTTIFRGEEGANTNTKMLCDFSLDPENIAAKECACPTEQVLAALSSCLIIGISYNASFRNISIETLEIDAEANIDIGGFLGLEAQRNGFNTITLTYRIKTNASESDLRALVSYVQKTSPVFDIITNKLDNFVSSIEEI
ncbi:MAG: hypothetical protein COA45_00045 [Zetaproteobacteria bacterium]|nr:MAG: hypothetical protein COA45_00045 [Zetaproteobacteria bacterium]